MVKGINIDGVYEATNTLYHRILTIGGQRHGAAWIYDQCMRAFDCEALPAEAITFSVYIGSPVMKPGEATIHRDGRLEMHTI